MRLMPPGHSMGWTAYAWLIYLGFFLIDPIAYGFSIAGWALTALVIVTFLGLYFRAFWVVGVELLFIILAILSLGIIAAPFNSGSSAFFIYAAAFACDLGPPRKAVPVIGVIVVVCLAEAWMFDLPIWFWLPGSIISIVVGGANIHWSERRRAATRLREVQDEMAAVAERDRIARDLHDLLGHNLSMITLKSELASKLVDRDPVRAQSEIREVEAISRETLGRVRDAVTGFRSQGLATEAELVRKNLESAGIVTNLSMAPLSLEPVTESILALFLREAGTNIIRHSRAKHAWIDVSEGNGSCEIEIRDDGRGGVITEGFGIRGMRTRIEAIGGSLDLESGEGTVVRASIPIDGGGN